MDSSPIWFSYLMNGLTIGTFIIAATILAKFMRWTGVIDTELKRLIEWRREHERHHDIFERGA